jgi:type IV secretion system protein TrbE
VLKNSKGTSPEAPWQEVMPWLDLVTPELMLCKDGSVLAGFDYLALDPDNLDADVINDCTSQLQRAFSSFDTRFSAWIIATKMLDKTYPHGDFENEVSQALDDIVKAQFSEGGNIYAIKHRIYISYTGNTGVNKYMDTVQAIMNDGGTSIPMAFLKAANPASASKNAALHDIKQLKNNINEMEMALKTFVGTLSSMRITRLVGWDLESALAMEANVTAPPTTKYKKPPGVLFDGWASQSEIDIGRELIKVTGVVEHRFVAQLALKEYPPDMTSLMLANLLSSGKEIKICHAIKFLDQEAATKEIDSAMDYYYLTQFSLAQRVVHKLSGGVMTPRPGKQDLYLQCVDAKRRQMADGLGHVMHAMSMSVFGHSIKDCETNVESAYRIFSDSGFSVIRERLNLAGSFASMLPGQWATQIRLQLQNTEAVSDCAPIYTLDSGSPTHEYFSLEIYKEAVAAFSVFQNVQGGKSNFTPHVNQVGHMIIVAPTGGGKTTFVNFEMSQFQRYKGARTIVFDRDYSCRITTELHGGTCLDMRTGEMNLNPLTALRDGSDDGLAWCREFILRRLSESNYESTAEDRREIDAALANLQKSSQPLSLTVLATQLPSNLKLQLGEWLVGRPYGMFDSFEDDFSLSKWTCIEMKEIMGIERVARAFLDYAFRKISVALTGAPTFIYLEEASFLLNHPAFADMIDDWLKTLRKKNAFLWMTIQSPTAVTNSKIQATLLDNVKSVLLLANPRIENHREAYKKNFGLTDQQVDRIKTLRPAREYMVIKDGFSRILRTMFDENSLAFLRSEVGLQKIFIECRDSGDPGWRANYLNQVTRRNV